MPGFLLCWIEAEDARPCLRSLTIALGPPGGPPAEVLAWRAAQHADAPKAAFEVRHASEDCHSAVLSPSVKDAPPVQLPASPRPHNNILKPLVGRWTVSERFCPCHCVAWCGASDRPFSLCMHARRRLGSEAVEAKLTLEVDWQPARFRLSGPLASLVGVQSDTRARVLQASPCYLPHAYCRMAPCDTWMYPMFGCCGSSCAPPFCGVLAGEGGGCARGHVVQRHT